MDFDPTEEQRLLRESVERLLADHYGFDKRRAYLSEPDGWSRALWEQYAELGLLGLPFAEDYGGGGGGAGEGVGGVREVSRMGAVFGDGRAGRHRLAARRQRSAEIGDSAADCRRRHDPRLCSWRAAGGRRAVGGAGGPAGPERGPWCLGG